MGRRPDPARRAALLEAVADEIAEQGIDVSRRPLAAAGSPAELARALWALAGTREADRFLRVVFELSAGGLRDPDGRARFLRDAVESWLVPLAASLRDTGLDPEAVATDAVATFHGLLMDRMATGDEARVELGFALLVARLEAAGGG